MIFLIQLAAIAQSFLPFLQRFALDVRLPAQVDFALNLLGIFSLVAFIRIFALVTRFATFHWPRFATISPKPLSGARLPCNA